MNDLQLFNLNWLCYAMTAPSASEERYYYDGQAKKFFKTRPTTDGIIHEFFNMVDLEIDKVRSVELRN